MLLFTGCSWLCANAEFQTNFMGLCRLDKLSSRGLEEMFPLCPWRIVFNKITAVKARSLKITHSFVSIFSGSFKICSDQWGKHQIWIMTAFLYIASIKNCLFCKIKIFSTKPHMWKIKHVRDFLKNLFMVCKELSLSPKFWKEKKNRERTKKM